MEEGLPKGSGVRRLRQLSPWLPLGPFHYSFIMHTCTHAHMHTHMSARAHMHAHVHTRVHIHTRTLTHVHTHTCTLTCAHTHTRTLTHVHTHTRARTHALPLISSLLVFPISSPFLLNSPSPPHMLLLRTGSKLMLKNKSVFPGSCPSLLCISQQDWSSNSPLRPMAFTPHSEVAPHVTLFTIPGSTLSPGTEF